MIYRYIVIYHVQINQVIKYIKKSKASNTLLYKAYNTIILYFVNKCDVIVVYRSKNCQ